VLAFSKYSREAFSNALAHGLIGWASIDWENVQLCRFLQTNENVAAHPQTGELCLELAQKGNPPGAPLGAGLEPQRDVLATKFQPTLPMLD
jgi:hypothetical protein